MLSFVGYRHEVIPIMQRISHGTRAFIISATGLRGFLIKFDPMKILREADLKGLLDDAKKW